jgi:hypothetical protein
MASVTSRLELDTTNFRAGIDAAKAGVNDLRVAAQRGLNLGGMITGGAAIAAFRQIASEMDNVATKAAQIGVSAETMQKLSHVADQNGTDVETLSRAFTRLNVTLAGSSEVSTRAAGALEKLGLEKAAFAAATVEQKLTLVADAFASMEDRGAASAAIVDLFGQRAAEMTRLFAEGGENIRNTMESLTVVSDEDVARIKKINDTLDTMGQSARNAGASLLGSWIEAIEYVGGAAGVTFDNIAAGLEGIADGRPIAEIWEEGKFRLEQYHGTQVEMDATMRAHAEEQRDRERQAAVEREAAAEKAIADAEALAEHKKIHAKAQKEYEREQKAADRERESFQKRMEANIERMTEALDKARTTRQESLLTDEELLDLRYRQLQQTEEEIRTMESAAEAGEQTQEQILDLITAQIRQEELLLEIRQRQNAENEKATAERERELATSERQAEQAEREARTRMEGSAAGRFDSLRSIGLSAAGVNYAAAPASKELAELQKQTRELENIRQEIRDQDRSTPATFAGL